jgi:flavin-binding protein dodecin
VEAAERHGLHEAADSVQKIRGAWVSEIKLVRSDDGAVTEWRMNSKVSFVVD